MSDIKSYLHSFIQKAEPVLDQLIDLETRVHAQKTDPLCEKALKNFKSYAKGGKMIRGGLTLLGYKIAKGTKEKEALKAAVAIEIIQSFLLVHDDWMDKDSLRRGRKTIHFQYQKNPSLKHYAACMAVSIGDFGHSFAHKIITDLDIKDSHKIEALSYLLRLEINTVYGQMMDLTYDIQKNVSWDQIIKVRELKTAYYTMVMPLLTGSTLAAGKNEKRKKAIISYGLPVGIAFQLQDDILGIFGDQEKFGKSTSSDLTEGKKSLLLVKALELSKGKDKKTLKAVFGNPKATSKQIEKARQIIKDSGALEHCQNLAQSLVKKGIKAIPKITTNKEYASILETLALYVVSRSK